MNLLKFVILICLGLFAAGMICALAFGDYPLTAVAYTASYQPSDVEARLVKIETDIAEIKKNTAEILRIAKAAETGVPPGAQAQRAGSPLVTGMTVCMACHTAQNSSKGGDMVIFTDDGRLAPLSARDAKKVIALVNEAKMPPPKAVEANKARALSAEEKAAIAAEYGKLIAR